MGNWVDRIKNEANKVASELNAPIKEAAEAVGGNIRSSWYTKTVHDKTGDLGHVILNRAYAEITSMTVFAATGLFLDNVYDFKPVKQVMGKIIEPAVGVGDWVADKLPALESDEETEYRHNAPDWERAYMYADVVFDTAAKIASNAIAQEKTMKFLNNHTLDKHLPENSSMRATIADKVVSWTSVAVLNFIVPNQNEQVQDSLQSMIEKKTGMPKDDANTLARDAINIQVPNLLGAATSVAALMHSYHNSR